MRFRLGLLSSMTFYPAPHAPPKVVEGARDPPDRPYSFPVPSQPPADACGAGFFSFFTANTTEKSPIYGDKGPANGLFRHSFSVSAEVCDALVVTDMFFELLFAKDRSSVGCVLEVTPSTIPDGGNGVYVFQVSANTTSTQHAAQYYANRICKAASTPFVLCARLAGSIESSDSISFFIESVKPVRKEEMVVDSRHVTSYYGNPMWTHCFTQSLFR